MLAGKNTERVAFGLFEADLHAGELWKAGYRIKLPRQPFRVLAALVARPGDIVTRADLQQAIWGENVYVDFDQAIAAAINKIREALGDSADNPRFIQTVTRHGYRFIAPVTYVSAVPLAEEADRKSLEPSSTQNSSNALALTERKVTQAWAAASFPGATTTGAEPSYAVLPVDPVGEHEPEIGERVLTTVSSPRSAGWRQNKVLSYLLLVTVALLAGALIEGGGVAPTLRNAPFRIDQISRYVPISLGPPNPESFLTTAVDGNRLITSVMVSGLPRLSSIDLDTGEVHEIAVPDEISSNSLTDISKDGSKLLLRSQQSTESEQPLWVVPSMGGSGRQVPGVLAHDATWMPDGASILYANGNDLSQIRPNEDSSSLYAKLPGRAFWLRWSPDGNLLRFTLFNPVTHAAELWELRDGNHTAHPVAIPNLNHFSACCGVWLPDGQSYVFQANDNLWQLKGFGRGAMLIQLTNGPLRSLSPVAARNGNRILFVGLEAPSGLQEFDPGRKEFRSAPAFLADANRIDYSKDGKWVAWTDIHEKLWRARIDGSDKVRLTSDALEVFLAHWAPDGKRLAVMARKPGGVWQIYIVDAGGGKTRLLLGEARNVADPGWSADGNSLVFGREPDLMGKENGSRTLQIINLTTHQTNQIPDSANLFSPRWSPDGHWIVALTSDQNNVMLYDVARRRWLHLASTSAADPVWSTDSKAIFVHAFLADREPILRIEVPSGAMHTIADLGNFHDEEAANYFFGGITLQDEPLVQPRVGTGNLYVLNLSTP